MTKIESSPSFAAKQMPPGWWCAALSVPIALHFLAILGKVFAVPSGPWPAPGAGGALPAPPPAFATPILQSSLPWLSATKLTHNYHFAENRPSVTARFEAILRDAQGNEIATLKFPDAAASAGVRHRQQLLARELAQDEPVEPPPGEWVPAPGKTPRAIPYWNVQDGKNHGVLDTIPENRVREATRERGTLFQPTDWATLLARSYARYLCAAHGAASVEIVRKARTPNPPMLAFQPETPVESAFDDESRSFGVMNAEATDR